LALLLACVGLYGLLSFEIARRTREIGVRIALGATRRDVFRLVMGQGIWLALVGTVSGIVVSLAVTRYLQSILYEVKPSDPVTYCAVGVLILLVASAASFVPTKRAMDVEPMVALRHE
jgi:ABC-type antimicrobial peptide transport system permease subunit